MRKRMWVIGIVLVLAAAFCVNAYAGDASESWHGFWDSVGGFLYNALPWNWGSWMGSK